MGQRAKPSQTRSGRAKALAWPVRAEFEVKLGPLGPLPILSPKLAQFNSNPITTYIKATLYVLCYLKGTHNLCIVYQR